MAPKFVHQHCVILSSRFWSLNCFSLFSLSRFHSITHSEYLLTASYEDFGSSWITNCFVHFHRVDTPAVVDCWLGVTSAAACWAWTCSDKADSLTHSVATDILPFSPLIWNNCLHNELIIIEALSLMFCLEHSHNRKQTCLVNDKLS